MIFPRDGNAGGSWISLCDNGNAGVLLNGAFVNHQKRESYLKSRGMIFLEIMKAGDPLQEFLSISLTGIEPFTLGIWQENNLYECKWDDTLNKHCKQLQKNCAYIWSSVTLYDEETRRKKETQFAGWLKQHPEPSTDDLLKFHFLNKADNKNTVVNSKEKFLTVSVTVMELTAKHGNLDYIDLVNRKTQKTTLYFSHP